MISSVDQVYLLLTFVVPGFIFHSTYSIFIQLRAQRADLDLLKFLTLSAVNFAALSPFIFVLVSPKYANSLAIFIPFGWFAVLFMFPVLFGVTWAMIQKRGLLRRFMHWAGFSPIHPIPTGWDWQFGRMDEPKWVLITLTDGSQIAGLFGSNSMASTAPDERDIYIEEIYKIIGDDNPWKKCERSDGILIPKDKISYIEFWKYS